MPSRPPLLGTALLLGGALVLFVSVIAQLVAVDGAAQTLWVLVSIAGGALTAAGIAVLVRRAGRGTDRDD